MRHACQYVRQHGVAVDKSNFTLPYIFEKHFCRFRTYALILNVDKNSANLRIVQHVCTRRGKGIGRTGSLMCCLRWAQKAGSGLTLEKVRHRAEEYAQELKHMAQEKLHAAQAEL